MSYARQNLQNNTINISISICRIQDLQIKKQIHELSTVISKKNTFKNKYSHKHLESSEVHFNFF